MKTYEGVHGQGGVRVIVKENGKTISTTAPFKTWQDAEEWEAEQKAEDEKTRPDWSKNCENCGQSPIVPLTGMCGPCTFGEGDTAGGNW